MNPIVEQEKKNDKTIMAITENICAEVSPFNGKTYVGIRKWYQKDGRWFRSKNGLSVEPDDFNDIAAQFEEITKFVLNQLKGREERIVEVQR